MKKLLSVLMLALFIGALAACGSNGEDNGDNGDPNGDPNGNGNGNQVEDPEIITFASWEVGTQEENNLLRRRIQKFNDTHTDIQIEIIEYEGNCREFLSTQAAAGEFPDVFSVANVPEFVINEWIADISSIANADSEWDNIPEALRESATYGNYVYAIPSAQHYLGFYANIDLIEDSGSNADFENLDYTFEEWADAVRGMRDTSGITDGSGTIGLNNTFEFVNWLPSILDQSDEISHFVWEGNGFNFTSEYLSESLAIAADLFTNGYTYESYSWEAGGDEDNPTPSRREELFGTNDVMAGFFNAKLGFIWEASWGASGIENNVDGLFHYDFVGLPDSRVIGVSDYYGISRAASNPELAYEVAKYLTFGEDGLLAAFDIIDEAADEGVTLAMNGLPINETPAIADRWFETYPQPGFQNAFEKAASGE